MIIIIRIFVVFVDDTSSSLQTFKEILAFFGKWFGSILLEAFQGIFFKELMIFLSFFSGLPWVPETFLAQFPVSVKSL